MNTASYDVAIIGSGPGGFSASIHLVINGKKVCIIDNGILGGTCLNTGCIPTKVLVAGQHQHLHKPKLGIFGIKADTSKPNFKIMHDRMVGIVEARRENERQLFQKKGIDYYQGTASFRSPNLLEVEMEGQPRVQIKATNVIIASGSKPITIPGIDFSDYVIDSSKALDLKTPPKSLCVIGGGAIGCELAQIFSTFGSSVSIIEALDSLLPSMDVDLQKHVAETFEKHGIKVFTGVGVKSVTQSGDEIQVNMEDGKLVSCKKALMCIGRRSDVSNMKLENADVAFDEKINRIVIDKNMKTTQPSIYAVGDVAPGAQLANKGVHEGFLAAENILGQSRENAVRYYPSCVFIEPAVASIGITEQECDKGNVKVFKSFFKTNAYAEAYASQEGFVKLIVDKKTEKILGVHIAGEIAVDLIGQASLMVNQELKITDYLDIALSLPHPSFSEVIRDAVRNLYCEIRSEE